MSAAYVSSSDSIENKAQNLKIWCLIAGSQKLSSPRSVATTNDHTLFLKRSVQGGSIDG